MYFPTIGRTGDMCRSLSVKFIVRLVESIPVERNSDFGLSGVWVYAVLGGGRLIKYGRPDLTDCVFVQFKTRLDGSQISQSGVSRICDQDNSKPVVCTLLGRSLEPIHSVQLSGTYATYPISEPYGL